MSEIDDIFASKAKGSTVQPASSASPSSEKKGENKRAKRKRDEHTTDHSTHIPLPQTVIDTSNNLTETKRPKTESKSRSQKPSKKVATADDMKFSDSRGARPRKTTEEGWLIYKEEELGMRDEGGDTPLCPFDCDCCF